MSELLSNQAQSSQGAGGLAMNEDIHSLQFKFSVMYGQLLLKADALGYGIAQGEGWRPAEVAEIYAKQGKGKANSLHIDKLVHDIDLFSLQDSTHTPLGFGDYEVLGIWWESIGGTWGGRWGDVRHFSLAYGGRK